MNVLAGNRIWRRAWLASGLGGLLLVAACDRPSTPSWQGYFEGEFVYLASPLAGHLDQLAVQKGARVEAGAPIFTLERASEIAAQKEATEQARQLAARLEDLKKGQRPTEIAALEARLAQARAVTELSQRQLARASQLRTTQVAAEEEFDRARWQHEANVKLVSELEAQLATARLGGRADAITAAEAQVNAAQAALERARWQVTQKAQAAPAAALVYDTLYRPGEFVPAGFPVVCLLPPENIKIRFFVTEPDLASFKAGDLVQVKVTGRLTPLSARVTYVSSRPEYTPPVLYNRENRAKLVFMLEATPVDPAIARDLHPGQPADVSR